LLNVERGQWDRGNPGNLVVVCSYGLGKDFEAVLDGRRGFLRRDLEVFRQFRDPFERGPLDRFEIFASADFDRQGDRVAHVDPGVGVAEAEMVYVPIRP